MTKHFAISLFAFCLGCGSDSSDPSGSSGGSSSGGSSSGGSSSGGTSSGGTSSGGTSSGGTSTGGTSTGGGPHAYTPFALSDCDEGALGANADGMDALESTVGADTVYSDEQALDGVGKSCKSFGEAGENFFGGHFRTPNMDVGDQDDVWIRQALFFPNGFCFGYGDTSGDGWGATKWIRLEFDDGNPNTGGPGSRLTLQLGNFANGACNASTEIWGATREYAGTVNCPPSSIVPLETGAWHMLQWQVHMAADDSGFIRFWLDEQYLGQWDGQTLPDSKPKLDFVVYGDYWNGSPHADVEWYMDDVIMTSEPPDTLDSGGRPYISPLTRVSDWD